MTETLFSDGGAGALRVGIACNRRTRDLTVTPSSLERLRGIADVVWADFEDDSEGYTDPPPHDAEAEKRLAQFAAGLDGLVISKGCPKVTPAVLDAAPGLKLVGDLQGDRFGRRIDVAAARSRGVRAIDTTHGSSDPVAEWALGLMLNGLRNAGSLFRRMIAGEVLFTDRMELRSDPAYLHGELTGKTVGLVAFGHIGRRLVELLAPFRVNVLVHDPYAPRVLADVYDLTMTSLERLFADSDVVVVLAPLTSQTRGMIGAAELGALKPGAVFVNVSRGPVVDSAALLDRLRRGDVIGCLDVFDPEPIPVGSELRTLPNVFLTPHIAGVTAECGPRFFDLMVDELLRCFAGHETRHDLVPREDLGSS
ncbi:hydroxyacid dehydrogenase [Jiangella ureilytica]|uniref:Hydroxyacid dehydrogenase n=1 Tax=Jiangella ureilytica TaxID=2530374 RepID=A0A4R4RBN9_9ACTN|nr:hydroxyacid dehydrogenase [Jiangella ureilytica]TDC45843.1 hydroxyacid dehydrogenase [Jiangella ureilytica]